MTEYNPNESEEMKTENKTFSCHDKAAMNQKTLISNQNEISEESEIEQVEEEIVDWSEINESEVEERESTLKLEDQNSKREDLDWCEAVELEKPKQELELEDQINKTEDRHCCEAAEIEEHEQELERQQEEKTQRQELERQKTEVFNVNNCDAVGFDMDHTLCRYNVPALRKQWSEIMVQVLIQKYNYPQNFLNDFVKTFDDIVCAGGLIYDMATGSFLKIDVEGNIEKMFQNKAFLSPDEINKHFEGGQWPHAEKFKQGVINESGVYCFMEENFNAAVMSTLAAILSYEADMHRYSTGTTPGKKLYFKAFKIFCKVYNWMWNPHGPYLRNIKNNIKELFPPVSQAVKDWLKELRNRGKFVFLLTSAQCDYTELVMSSCFDPHWRDWFDLTISVAGKPSFYTEMTKFTSVDTSR